MKPAADLSQEICLEAEEVSLPVVRVKMVQVLVEEQLRRLSAQIFWGEAVPAAGSCPGSPLGSLLHCAQPPSVAH